MAGVAPRDAYVALGSNLGDSASLIRQAAESLASLPDTALVACSRLYRTAPWGIVDQPDFINAVVHLRTTLAPATLLDALQAIEARAGRVRDGERWGPRTLDLDLLHIEGITLQEPRLTLPHPRMAERAFVLQPLADVAPDLALPGFGQVAKLLAGIDRSGCVALS